MLKTLVDRSVGQILAITRGKLAFKVLIGFNNFSKQ
jgi:hypothetical protein